ncbi:MAG TPA: class I SAM-dependent methyltransferase [Longimicrobium sp.]
MSEKFDSAYMRSSPLFGTKPSEELEERLRMLPVEGTALDLGCGDGRDTILLLQHGLRVVALDQSRNAVQNLIRRAEGLGLSDRLSARASDVRNLDWLPGPYNVIVATTLLDHLQREDARSVIGACFASAAPGCVIFAEVHTVEDPAVTGIGPVSEFASEIRHYFEPNELLALFYPRARILSYKEMPEWDYDHGPPHLHAFATVLALYNERTSI